jgi:hypothetical protein
MWISHKLDFLNKTFKTRLIGAPVTLKNSTNTILEEKLWVDRNDSQGEKPPVREWEPACLCWSGQYSNIKQSF